MKDPLYGADRSLTLYVAAEREHTSAPTSEATLTAIAVLALLAVLAVLVIGGG